jgi:hypothetical protein
MRVGAKGELKASDYSPPSSGVGAFFGRVPVAPSCRVEGLVEGTGSSDV